jgi:NAD(P)-dependent dehydrogenase (short-subunit alcohol dehydrogenase family)
MTKTIFITGTSSGLGKLTAFHFAKRGWNVAATMRTPEKESELTAYDNIKIFKLDVTDVQQVQVATEQAIAAFGKIDVVVNNAGAGSYGPLEFAEESTIDWQFALNVRGPINVIRGFLPHFRANKGAMFINISSFMGVLTAVPTGSLYNMSKFALEGLTEGLYYVPLRTAPLYQTQFDIQRLQLRSVSCTCLSSALLTNSTESIAPLVGCEIARSLLSSAAAGLPTSQ